MKPFEMLSTLPQWSKTTPEEIIASPAWAVPCRLGDAPCKMRPCQVRPADTLNLAIRLEDEDIVLGLADTPVFPELHAIWSSRADMPEPLLLALVEKDCGTFLQLLENAVRRQLKIVGLSSDAPGPGEKTLFAQLVPDEGDQPTISFALSPVSAVAAALGQLRCLDTSHPEVRDTSLHAETEYAAFTLSAQDLASLAPGCALLLPEIGTLPPRTIVEGRLVLAEGTVAQWSDDGRLRACAEDGRSISAGELLDAAEGTADTQPATPPENTPLKIVHSGKTLAHGRLERIGSQFALSVESVG